MPNTLCHIGIQAPLNGFVIQKSDILWVVLACIIPDLPWVLLKLLFAVTTLNPYDLRLFCTAQASMLFCLILSAGLSLLSKQSGKVFLILGANSLFHLLLDSLQKKWGNGVNIIAPFDWKLFHLDLFWPEYTGIIILTIVGFFYLIRYWSRIVRNNPLQLTPHRVKYVLASLCFLLYFTAPVYFMNQLEEADTYFIHTMRQNKDRPGKIIKLDRAHYISKIQEVKAWNGEHFKVKGNLPESSGRVSFSGIFLDSSTIQSREFHLHNNYRDLASLLGLFMACTLVLHSLVLAKFNRKKPY